MSSAPNRTGPVRTRAGRSGSGWWSSHGNQVTVVSFHGSVVAVVVTNAELTHPTSWNFKLRWKLQTFFGLIQKGILHFSDWAKNTKEKDQIKTRGKKSLFFSWFLGLGEIFGNWRLVKGSWKMCEVLAYGLDLKRVVYIIRGCYNLQRGRFMKV